MIGVHVFVTGGAARAQFVAAASQGLAASSSTTGAGTGTWVCLTAQVAGQRLSVHLFDGRLLANRPLFNELLFEGLVGFIVIDDGSADAEEARRLARALAPTPYVVVDMKVFDLTDTGAVKTFVAGLLEQVFENLDDEKFNRLIHGT